MNLKKTISSGEPFCILAKRSQKTLSVEQVTVLEGEIKEHTFIRELPKNLSKEIECVSIVPFAQIKERGFYAISDNERILSLHVKKQATLGIESLSLLNTPSLPSVQLKGHNMTLQDFEERVASIVKDVIGGGEGSNFLLSRKTYLRVQGFNPLLAMSVFKKLIETEIGFYLGFIFFDGNRYFIGASPERHLSVINGLATMNPICGTLPKSQIKNGQDFINFLKNPKEIDELFQVVDETLKMMSKICYRGGNIIGPKLKEMGTLFHTEYDLEGIAGMSCHNAFLESMYAPTMLGSPIESAARIISKYENDSRRYYSSAIVIQGCNLMGDYLDSAITIRTLEIDTEGNGIVQAGASIVRGSNPKLESKEIEAKSSAVMGIFTNKSKPPVKVSLNLDDFKDVLHERNNQVSSFWLKKTEDVPIGNFSALIVDNEDDFIYMIRHILVRLGGAVDIFRPQEVLNAYNRYDLIVLGPGPGNPEDDTDLRIKATFNIVERLFKDNTKFLGVCLGHQIIARYLGLPIKRVIPPPQGTQKKVNIRGKSELVGLYNSFFAFDSNSVRQQSLSIDKDDNNRIYALHGENFSSFQFHPESILTENGYDAIRTELQRLGIIPLKK